MIPYAIASSFESAPTPTMRSMKMRLPVRGCAPLSRTWRVSAKAFGTLSRNPAGRSAFTPPTRP